MGKSEAIHLLGLPLNHSLEDLAGIISDIQHGDKTALPDAHHSKTHRHWKNRQQWTKEDATETSTSSTTYVRLVETVSKSVYAGIIVKIGFTHNVKNEGTLASRGATFKIGGTNDFGDFTITELRWTDNLADYKVMSVVITKAIANLGDTKFWVDWRVDNAAYPCWSKNRFLQAESFQQGGDYVSDT